MDPAKAQMVAELEIEMMTDLYNRPGKSWKAKVMESHGKAMCLAKGYFKN